AESLGTAQREAIHGRSGKSGHREFTDHILGQHSAAGLMQVDVLRAQWLHASIEQFPDVLHLGAVLKTAHAHITQRYAGIAGRFLSWISHGNFTKRPCQRHPSRPSMRVKQAIRFIYSAKAEKRRVLIRFFFEMRVESGRASTYCGRKRKRSLSHT